MPLNMLRKTLDDSCSFLESYHDYFVKQEGILIVNFECLIETLQCFSVTQSFVILSICIIHKVRYYYSTFILLSWFVPGYSEYLNLSAHSWQKWKSTFLTCQCHKIYREEAVCLKTSIILEKLRFLWICEVLANFMKIWYLSITA